MAKFLGPGIKDTLVPSDLGQFTNLIEIHFVYRDSVTIGKTKSNNSPKAFDITPGTQY